jgi:hypothetical protein
MMPANARTALFPSLSSCGRRHPAAIEAAAKRPDGRARRGAIGELLLRLADKTLLVVALGLLALAGPAGAQGFQMSRSGEQQIQVYSDNGIEWHSDELRVIARGNANAVRGDVTITADVLTAHYRKGDKGDEIWPTATSPSVRPRIPPPGTRPSTIWTSRCSC